MCGCIKIREVSIISYVCIVADNYLEPRFEKISKKFRKWHGVLSANLEPETKTTGF